MNEMLARAGAFFIAPPAQAAERPVPLAPPPPPTRAAVLAHSADLPSAAGAVAASLRARNRAVAAVVCLSSVPAPVAPALPGAAAAARRLASRDLAATASGSLCRVELPADAAAFVVGVWRVLAAAGLPVVIGIAQRDGAHDDLLKDLDLLALAVPAETDAALADVAAASLERLGPPVARIAPPANAVARKAAAAGLLRAPLPELVAA
jgi:hypothetical protein